MQQDVQTTAIATLPPSERAVIALESTKTEKQLRELVTYSAGIVAVADKDSREEAHRAGMSLKNARVAIEKAGKAAREDAQAFAKAVIDEQKRLIGITQAEEDRVFALRDGYDAKVRAEKEEAERRERERVAAIRAKIDGIKNLPAASFRDNAADIQATLDDLDAYAITEADFAEFAGEAADAKGAALVELRDLHAKAVAAEEEVARVAAERVELERQRAEVAERERQDAEARKAEEDRLRAEREAFEAERRAFQEQQAAAARAGQEQAAREEAAELASAQDEKPAEPELIGIDFAAGPDETVEVTAIVTETGSIEWKDDAGRIAALDLVVSDLLALGFTADDVRALVERSLTAAATKLAA